MAVMSDQDIERKLGELDGWSRTEVGGKPGIQKVFRTGNFLAGLGFVTKIAVLAEKADHHPDLVFTYPRVTVQLTTHDAGGLTRNDFDLAAAIDTLRT